MLSHTEEPLQDLPNIAVLSTEAMLPIWESAAGFVRANVSVTTDASRLSHLESMDGVICQSPGPRLFTAPHVLFMQPLPSVVPPVSETVSSSFFFRAELFGCPLISHHLCELHSTLERGSSFLLPPAHSTGPGVHLQWDLRRFDGRGSRVSRDDTSVLTAISKSTWIDPSFPFLVHPRSYRCLDGSLIEGLLCKNPSDPGGWLVLSRRDVLDVLGHPGDLPWESIPSLFDAPSASVLLDWLIRIILSGESRLPPATAGIHPSPSRSSS